MVLMEDATIFTDKSFPVSGAAASAREVTEIEIPADVQVLLRRWIRERDKLDNQINGVLQALVIGTPGVWNLDESASYMVKATTPPLVGGQTER